MFQFYLLVTVLVFLIFLLIVVQPIIQKSKNIIHTHKDNLAYLLSIGDTFQIKQSFSSFHKSNSDIFLYVKSRNGEFDYGFHDDLLVDAEFEDESNFFVKMKSANLFLIRSSRLSVNGNLNGYFFVLSEISLQNVLVALLVLLLTMMFGVGLWGRKLKLIFEDMITPVSELINVVKRTDSIQELSKIDIKQVEFIEFEDLVDNIQSMSVRIDYQEEKLLNAKISKEKFRLALQVAHDLRSPVSALDIIKSSLTFKSDEEKELFEKSIQRVNTICNDLLSSEREIYYPQNDIGFNLEAICNEKKVLNSNLIINCDSMDMKDVEIDFHKIERIFSNILNNAIESYGKSFDQNRLVEISSERVKSRMIKLIIKDYGKGIPPDILKVLGKKKISYGKDDGNGLGIYDASEYMKSIGGWLEIESQLGEGTTVNLFFKEFKS